MKQLKVATFSRGLLVKINKIEHCLDLFPEGITPDGISKQTGLNVNTIKSILPKMKNAEKRFRGVYFKTKGGDAPLTSDGDSFMNWNFHNLILSTRTKVLPLSVRTSSVDADLLKLDFRLGTSGKAVLRVSTDYPVNVSSIVLCALELGNFIVGLGGVIPKFSQINVETIEFNKDYTNLRLDGVKSITLDKLTEQFKLYQKRQGLRVEHKTKVKFNVENLVDMLSNDPNSLDVQVKLSKQKEQLDQLTLATQNHTKLLFKMIDKINKDLDL